MKHIKKIICFLLLGCATFGMVLAQSTAVHQVVAGDTLYDLAATYNTSVTTLKQLNNLNSSQIRVGQMLVVPSAPVTASGRVGLISYEVQAGDSFASVAEQFGLSELALKNANPELADGLVQGLRLRIPPAEGLVVQLGASDSLLSVAMRYGLTPSELVNVNGFKSLNDASAGQYVFVPETQLLASAALPVTASAEAGGAVTVQTPAKSLSTREQQRSLQLTALRAAPDLLPSYVPPVQTFTWPLRGALTSYFGRRNLSVLGNTFHGGIDIAGRTGTPIKAAAPGVVVKSGWGGTYGNVVYVNHPDGSQTRYAHMSVIKVAVGTSVSQGDTLGLVGSTGASTGPHLHFELRFDGVAVNPLDFLE